MAGGAIMKYLRIPGRTLLLLGVAVAVLVASPGVAAGDGTVSGQVTEAGTGVPVPGALVRAYEFEYGKPVFNNSGSTNAAGAYSFQVFFHDTDSYRFRVTCPGYLTQDTGYLSVPGGLVRDYSLQPDPQRTERVYGSDRYSTAVQVARERFTSPQNPTDWLHVFHVVIASGEDYAAADPLAAAGLCGAYEAPLFLVNSEYVPSSVIKAMREIVAMNKYVIVHIVGGSASVPDARFEELDDAITYPADYTLFSSRVISTGDRYDLAAAIARDIKDKNGNTDPEWALVANGTDPDKFFDALALSPISASQEFPILLVAEDRIPTATKKVLDELGNPDIVVGGGPATVSESVRDTLDKQNGKVERWWGPDRYRTATTVANEALEKGWLDGRYTSVAAKLPDALTAGAAGGQVNGVLLVTEGHKLSSATGQWLAGQKTTVAKCYVTGGPVSITDGVKSSIDAKLK